MERYEQTKDGNVRDTVTGFVMDIYYVVDLLNLKEERIKELEDLYESE